MFLGNPLAGFMSGNAVNAVDYNGSTDYLGITSPLTGVSDSQYGTLSLWFRLDGSDNNFLYLFDSSTHSGGSSGVGEVGVRRTSSGVGPTGNNMQVQLNIPAGGFVGARNFESTTTGQYLASATWHNLLLSFDINHAAGSRVMYMYIDDVDVKNITNDEVGSIAGVMEYSAQDRLGISISGDFNTALCFDGALAEIYWNPGTLVDFSVTANRRLFIDSHGKPVYLGTNGELPTGSQPAVYLNNRAATVGTNNGASDNFTINGSPTDASTSPSD